MPDPRKKGRIGSDPGERGEGTSLTLTRRQQPTENYVNEHGETHFPHTAPSVNSRDDV